MQQSRLHRKLLVGIVVLFFMMGIGGLLSLAHADDNEHATLSACNGDEASNPAGGGEGNAYTPFFNEEIDEETGEKKYSVADESKECTTCSVDSNGKLSSEDFKKYCDGVGKGEMQPGGVVGAMLNACGELKDSDPNKKSCMDSARMMEDALGDCKGDSSNLLSEDEERADVYENLLGIYCSAACNVQYALKHGKTKTLWDDLVDLAKAVVDFVIDVLSFIANMLSCLFSGEANVDTLPTRTHFVKVIWFGPIVHALLGGVNVIAYDSRDIVYGYARTLLGLGLAFWLLFRILKMAGSQKNVDLEAFLTDIGKAIMRALVAGALLLTAGGIFDILLIPIAETFSAATTIIVKAAGTGRNGDLCCGKKEDDTCLSSGSSISSVDDIIEHADLEEKMSAMLPKGTAVAGKDGEDNIIVKLGRPIVEAITSINTRLMMVMADGWALVKYGIMNAFLLCLIPRFNYVIMGAFFMAFAGILALIIPLRYLDALIKMGIAICLTPFFVTAWAFPSTQKYAYKGLNLFLHTFILVLVMSVAAVVCLTAINVAFGSFAGCDDASSIMDVINFESGKDAERNPLMYLLTMLVLLIACKKLVKSVPEIASNISGAPGGTSVGDSLGQMMGKIGSKGAQAAGAAANAAGSGIKSAASSAKDAFMKSEGGKAFMSKVQDSKLGQMSVKVSTLLKAPGNALASYKADRDAYRKAKQEDKGTLQGALLSVLGNRSLGEETAGKVKGISEGKGVRAKIAQAVLNKDNKVKAKTADVGKKTVNDSVDKMSGKAGAGGSVAQYLKEHNGKPSFIKSLKAEFSKAGGGNAGASLQGRPNAKVPTGSSPANAEQSNVSKEDSNSNAKTAEKPDNAKNGNDKPDGGKDGSNQGAK